MVDTATIEAPATAEAPEAPSVEELPEIAELEATPDPEGDPEAPETEETEEADPYEGLTPKEIAAKLREDIRKDERAKAAESVRRQLEAKAQEETTKAQAATFEANRQLAVRNRQGFAYQQLGAITKAAFDQGRDAPDQRSIAAVAQELTIASAHDAHEMVMGHLWEGVTRLNPEYRPSTELTRQAAAASAAYDLRGLAAIQLEMMGEAIDQVRGRQATARAEAESAAKAATKPIAPKAKGSGPTAIQGGSGRGGVPTTIREADAAVATAQGADARREALAVAKALRARGAPW